MTSMDQRKYNNVTRLNVTRCTELQMVSGDCLRALFAV